MTREHYFICDNKKCNQKVLYRRDISHIIEDKQYIIKNIASCEFCSREYCEYCKDEHLAYTTLQCNCLICVDESCIKSHQINCNILQQI